MPEKAESMTTIAVCMANWQVLNNRKRGRESFDDVLKRLFRGEVDIEVSVIAVDNELPQLHTLILQLGDDPKSLYHFGGKDFEPITLDEANKKMKSPKPNLTISKEQAEVIFTNLLHISRKDGNATSSEEALHTQLQAFLER